MLKSICGDMSDTVRWAAACCVQVTTIFIWWHLTNVDDCVSTPGDRIWMKHRMWWIWWLWSWLECWKKNKKAQLTQRERATAVHAWRPTGNKCKIRKNLYFSAQGHSRSLLSCQPKPVYDFLLVINCNLGPISYRFRDMATFRLKSLPPRAVQPFKVI